MLKSSVFTGYFKIELVPEIFFKCAEIAKRTQGGSYFDFVVFRFSMRHLFLKIFSPTYLSSLNLLPTQQNLAAKRFEKIKESRKNEFF